MKKETISLGLSLLAIVSNLTARELVVELGGDIANLPAARDAVRELRAGGEKGDIDVILKDGVYVLQETLIFGLEDSAPAGSVTRYRAAKGASPLISGGRVISGWEKSKWQDGKVWIAKVPWAKGDAFFHCLYDGSKLLPRARSEGFAVSCEGVRKKYAGYVKDRIHFTYTKNILKPFENLEDLELYGRPTRAWLVNYLGIESVDPTTQTAKLSVPATYNMYGGFQIENCVEHLDEPGEWALNSQKGILYYWPASGTPGGRSLHLS